MGNRHLPLPIEESVSHGQEIYLSISLDRGRRSFVVIAARSGGVEVESLEGKMIEPIPVDGLPSGFPSKVASKLDLTGNTSEQFQKILRAMETLSREQDCELVEINPLAVQSDGNLIALDSKVIIDDNALFRHPHFSQFSVDNPLEMEASKAGFGFVRLDGDIAVVGNGAGLVLSTLDLVADAGGNGGLLPRFGRRSLEGANRVRASPDRKAS